MKHLKSLIGFLILVVFAATWLPARMASSQAPPAAKSIPATGPWYVATGGNDSNSCLSPASPCATINAAIGKASGGDTVYVAEGTYTGEGEQVVLINKDITFSGGWGSLFMVQGGISIIDGNNERVGILVNSETFSTIEKFSIQSGFSERGAGILNSGNLLVINSTITGNTSTQQGGGIQNWHGGAMTITSSTVSNNEAKDNYGGGILNKGPMTISNTMITNNTAQIGGGGISNGGTITITGSTISNNTANDGAGLMNWTGQSAAITNSTIADNDGTTRGGGIFNLGTTNLNNVTITNNSATIPNTNNCTGGLCEGGGINDYGSTTIQNTIIAGNNAYRMPDCAYIIFSSGYNLIGDSTDCDFQRTSHDLIDVNPQLWPILTGSPGYHQLLANSPAINAGNPNGCTDHEANLLDTDQRSIARVGRCDIGAYEYDPNNNPLTNIYLSSLSNAYCPALYSDDFSDPASGWPVNTTNPDYRLEYLNGKYRMLLSEPNSWVVSGPDLIASEYVLSVDAVNTSGVDGTFGFIFAASDDLEQFYTFEIDLGNYYVYRYHLWQLDPIGSRTVRFSLFSWRDDLSKTGAGGSRDTRLCEWAAICECN